MDKSQEFFEERHQSDIHEDEENDQLQSLLSRLQNIAACFRNGFPEARFFLNRTWNNETSNQEAADDQDGESIIHTFIILSIFCSIVLLLVVRSRYSSSNQTRLVDLGVLMHSGLLFSRGGSWISCKQDVRAVAQAGERKKRQTQHRGSAVSTSSWSPVRRVPSWTAEHYAPTIHLENETTV
ncbi:hypothetical protein RvY_00617 [Ramazzottius varieornatus]|uniref:Uncharacterized protein n=1 Tax=Ramazzottius varieornatus TaxID=947166 RepID=A0A1D1UH32_RAMVA|nr:hypothetical protein RvY_00617 [Ramazzottius varieornatus]